MLTEGSQSARANVYGRLGLLELALILSAYSVNVSHRFLPRRELAQCLMPFERERESYTAKRDQTQREEGRRKSCGTSNRRWETFVSMNSRACLIHDLQLCVRWESIYRDRNLRMGHADVRITAVSVEIQLWEQSICKSSIGLNCSCCIYYC